MKVIQVGIIGGMAPIAMTPTAEKTEVTEVIVVIEVMEMEVETDLILMMMTNMKALMMVTRIIVVMAQVMVMMTQTDFSNCFALYASMPIFKGEKGEDPNIFKTKAKDYMEAQEIPRRDRVREFRHCLEGKARMWYNEIERQIHPRNSWTDLIQKFCGRFCIYGKESEDWYRHWSALHFDPASDADIDDLITEVRTLARLLNFPDPVVLATLKNMFPQQRMHFFNVNDLQTMFRMLRAMFPRNRNQAVGAAMAGATPFSAHQETTPVVHVTGAAETSKRSPKPKRQEQVEYDDSFDRLDDQIERLTAITDRRERNGRYRPNNRSDTVRKPPPFKPRVTRRQFNRTYHDNGPQRQYGRYNNYDRRPGRYQSYNRYNGNRYTDGYRNRSNWSRGFKYDRSPRGRKPRVASRTPDQDRNRCYNCHEFGHFARECQFQANNNQNNRPQPAEQNQNRRTPKPRPHVPGRKHRNTNASFQFSNQDDGIPSEDSEGEMEEPTHLHPFRNESSHLYDEEMSEEDFDSEVSEVECEELTHVNPFFDDPLNI